MNIGVFAKQFFFKIVLTSPIEILHEACYGVKVDLIKNTFIFHGVGTSKCLEHVLEILKMFNSTVIRAPF